MGPEKSNSKEWSKATYERLRSNPQSWINVKTLTLMETKKTLCAKDRRVPASLMLRTLELMQHLKLSNQGQATWDDMKANVLTLTQQVTLPMMSQDDHWGIHSVARQNKGSWNTEMVATIPLKPPVRSYNRTVQTFSWSKSEKFYTVPSDYEMKHMQLQALFEIDIFWPSVDMIMKVRKLKGWSKKDDEEAQRDNSCLS